MWRILALVSIAVLSLGGAALGSGYTRGIEAYKRGDYSVALAELRPLAEAGDPVAQFSIGYMYAEGRGVASDLRVAAEWFDKAARQGHAMAQFNLGLLYVGGKGVPEDPVRGAEWLGKAAEQGLASAQNNLGYLYNKGRGVPRDQVRAYMWLSLAASNGHQEARLNRDILAQHMAPEQIREAQQMAIQWLDRVRQTGSQEEPASKTD
ncbi:MAG TPA: tetratricopeptide repeat protein [Rhodospirillales bacterium]